MVQFCLDRKRANSLQVVKELKKSDVGFRKHVEELRKMDRERILVKTPWKLLIQHTVNVQEN